MDDLINVACNPRHPPGYQPIVSQYVNSEHSTEEWHSTPPEEDGI
jgi:hypothetical protein